jgi:HEPN domain-containing protein
MPTRAELKGLARTRLKEAQALCASGLYDGASYLAGYVVELALKVRICRILDLTDYPDTGDISRSFKTHKLDDLLRLAGLQRKFDQAKAANPNLLTNWSLVTQWSEQARYHPVGTSPRVRTEEILVALDDPVDGIFTWLKKYW